MKRALDLCIEANEAVCIESGVNHLRANEWSASPICHTHRFVQRGAQRRLHQMR